MGPLPITLFAWITLVAPPAPMRLRVDHRLLRRRVLDASLSPQFSFEVPSEFVTQNRSEAVTGFHLTVRTWPGMHIVWDSGAVRAPITHIPFGGNQPLRPDSDFEVTAQYLCRSGAESDPAVARFSTRLDLRARGIFNTSTWIVSPVRPAPQHVLFRRAFYVPAQSRSAPRRPRARVASALLGCGAVFVNGHRLGRAVLGTTTQFDKTVLYNTHDVSAFLNFGAVNILAASVGRCMAGLLNFLGDTGPTAKLALWYRSANGSTTEVSTANASTFWTARGPAIANDLYLGETYDAQLAEGLAGWKQSPNVSGTSAWVHAVAREAAAPPLTHNLQPHAFASQSVVTRLPPREISAPSAGTFVVDFGQEISGWVRLSRAALESCSPGSTLVIRHAEVLSTPPMGPDNGRLYVANLDGARQVDRYACSGTANPDTEDGSWSPTMTFHGFRFASISGLSVVPSFDSVSAELVHSDVERTGSLAVGGSSGARTLNRLHSNIVFSQRDNLMGIPIAQNNRNERLGWTGDAGLSVEEASFNFDVHGVETQFLGTIRDCLDYAGGVPHVVPGNPGCNHDGSIRTDPAWASVYPQTVWQMLRVFGDRSLAQQHWPHLLRMLLLEAEDARTCPASESPRTAVPNSPGCSPGGLGNMSLAIFGDWTVPPSRGNFTSAENNQIHFVAAFALLRDLKTLANIGMALGGSFASTTEETVAPLVTALASEFTRRFYDNQTRTFGPSATTGASPREGPEGRAARRTNRDRPGFEPRRRRAPSTPVSRARASCRRCGGARHACHCRHRGQLPAIRAAGAGRQQERG